MKKILVLGDIHGRTIWKDIVAKETDANTVVFVGDYFDSFTISGVEQLHNFEEIIRFKKESDKNVVLLIGNHDFHYFPEIGFNHTAGFQRSMFQSLSYVVNENRKHLQMCYEQDGFLFSHAGISVSWLKNVFKKDWSVDNVVDKVNELFTYKPKWFSFTGLDPYGDDPQQTPIWIRPRSLKIANNNTKLYKKYIQVVGHTHRPNVEFSGRTYFVDTFDTGTEYLTIVNGETKIIKQNE
jgi:predicted phosphodiesterase